MKISYNWLKSYVPELPKPEEVAEAIIFHAFEVEGVEKIAPTTPPDGTPPQAGGEDFIFDIKTLPDRNHDCLSHQGIAREVCAILDLKFSDPTPLYKIPQSQPTQLEIEIQTSSCRRYMGRIVRGIKVGPSPEWMVKHLESIGQRSINNIVDATNIVMYDCGQPIHAFDLKKSGEKIVIRNANKEEKITLLTGEEKELKESMMVISDANTHALAVAGVKGGKYAEVDTQTTDIVLEVANFEPTSVRKTAQTLRIHTDAVKRFENDLSPSLCDFAMLELSALIVEMCPDAIFEEIVDMYPSPEEVVTVSVTADFINKKLGTTYSADEMENVWKRLSFSYTREGETFLVTRPALRLDITSAYDFVEEVGRILGYDRLVPTLPKIDFIPAVNETFYKTLAAKKFLCDQGYNEVMTYSFRNKGDVQVLASASDKKFLRANLADGLSESLTLNTLNAPFLGLDQVRIFEIGTVFLKEGESIHIAYNEKKQIVEMTLNEFCEKNNIVIENSYGDLLNTDVSLKKFSPWSQYPFITRDIAVWVPNETESDAVYTIIKENAGELLICEPRLVDTYTKDDKTSYAFRLVFQSFEKTLTDEEVSVPMQVITDEILKRGYTVR